MKLTGIIQQLQLPVKQIGHKLLNLSAAYVAANAWGLTNGMTLQVPLM